MIDKYIKVIDLGNIDYKDSLVVQNKIHEELILAKMNSNKSGDHSSLIGYILLCQHPHVYTLGSSGGGAHLLITEKKLFSMQASIFKTNRGGDITYHGPGQLMAYFILDLSKFCQDLHKYLRLLEEIIIQLLHRFCIKSYRLDNLTGVWVGEKDSEKKICAIGIKVKNWVTMHGLALNVNTDLNYFNHIIPCGIQNKGITSMQEVLKLPQEINEISDCLIEISNILLCDK